MKSPIATIALPTACALGLLALSGCGRAEVEVYEVPKEASQPALPGADTAAPVAGGVAWQPDEGWQELAPTAFRKGNYIYQHPELGAVEITVSSFPGQTGGLLANVNRWLGQAGLSAIDQAQLNELTRVREVAGHHEVFVVDLAADAPGPTDPRIYAATTFHGGHSWFFKMSGPHDAVASQLEAFDDMITELVFDHGDEEHRVAAENTATGGTGASEITFEAPEGWIEKPGSSVRIASYEIAKEGLPPADFSITSFPGDTGGTTANVNRWRAQIGLPAWNEAQVNRRAQKLVKDSRTFLIFDLKADTPAESASAGNERIIAAILQVGDRSWFFKLRGDALLLETQRNKFLALLDSVAFPAASR